VAKEGIGRSTVNLGMVNAYSSCFFSRREMRDF
jgi:hypothetical protein